MAITRGLSFDTRDTINLILDEENYSIERGQAKSILDQSIKSSIRRLKTSMRLRFMKQCRAEDVFTTTIMLSTKRLGLSRKQLLKTRQVMMKNDIKKLYEDLRNKNQELNQATRELKRTFGTNAQERIQRCWRKESEYVKKTLGKIYEKKTTWLRSRKRQEEEENLPKKIDNITMTDCELPEDFETDPRAYGGAVLSNEETELLKLPPKFAVYKKSDLLMLKAQFEKAITCLRWSENEARNNSEQEHNNNRESEGTNNETQRYPRQELFDQEENNFDFSFLRATHLPFNKRVYMPPDADERKEAKIAHARVEIERLLTDHTEAKDRKYTNLTKEQRMGLKTLQERVKKKEIVNYITDKSGRMCVDTPTNYIECMQVHLQNTEKVSTEEYRTIEKELNSHMHAWCNIIKADERVRRSLQMEGNEVPPQYGLRKDHKQFDDPVKGPPLRPVCGAVVGSNYRMSYFLSKILQPYIKQVPEICDSTADMLARVEKCNQDKDLKNCIIGSFDVEALYPSIDVDIAVEKCLELISENNITFKGIDFNEVGLYLALTTKKKDLEKEGLLDFCPTRCMSGRPPTVTSSGKNKDYEKRWKNWQRPLRKATDEMNKKLLMKAFEVALKLVMKNHIFTFNDENFKQLNGGAIGVSIAGDVANLFMVWWDRELKVRLDEARILIELYSRYVDDGNTAIQCPEDLIDCPNDEAEKETMDRVKTIANSIHQSIQVKVDHPSNHEDERMPILDTKMWIGEVEVRGEMKHQILYIYYEKAMSSKHVLHKESAISRGSKINILVNELLRVMRNTSLRVQQEEKDKHIQHFINKMQFSGYNQEDRVQVYQKAKRKFEEKTRGREVYPHVDKATRMKESTREKVQKRKEWFKQGKYKGVFYVDATPGGSLAKECQKVLDRCDIPIKTMEKTGDSIKKLLTKSNPFKPNNCGDPSCPVCTRDCKINCRSSDVVYQNYCVHRDSCGGEYDGETSDIIRDRFKEHLDDARLRPETSYMQKHIEEHHNGEQVEFKVKILGSCPGDAMLRQCMEAVMIRDKNPSMNSRAEWGTRRGRQRRGEPDTNRRNIEEQTNSRTTEDNNEAPTGITNTSTATNAGTSARTTRRRPGDRSRRSTTTNTEESAGGRPGDRPRRSMRTNMERGAGGRPGDRSRRSTATDRVENDVMTSVIDSDRDDLTS